MNNFLFFAYLTHLKKEEISISVSFFFFLDLQKSKKKSPKIVGNQNCVFGRFLLFYTVSIDNFHFILKRKVKN